MSEKQELTIVFEATISGVKTLADNGIRVTFDLPETAVTQAAQLMELRRLGVALVVSVAQDKTRSSWGS